MTGPAVPPFDLPDEHALQAQFWLTPLASLGRPITLGSVRVTRPGQGEVLRARVTHWPPPDRATIKDAAVDELEFAYPRHDGRASDVLAAALSLATAGRADGTDQVILSRDQLEQLVALARRAPLSAGDRGETERQVLVDVEQTLHPLRHVDAPGT